MKKNITIIVSLIISLSSLSQKHFPTKGPCTTSMLLEIKGKWIETSDLIDGGNAMTQEVISRMDAMHKIVSDLYPKPMGVDAGGTAVEEGLDYLPTRLYSKGIIAG